MSKRAKYKQMLRAGLVGDFDTAERLDGELGDVSWQDAGVLVNALFALAVQDRFEADVDRAEIRAFVTDTIHEYRSVEPPFKPLMTEGLIRSVLGEDDLSKEIPKSEAIPVQTAIVNKIVNDAGLSHSDIDALLDEAEALADRWSA